MFIKLSSVDHVTARLDPEPNGTYKGVVVLQRSDRWRSMNEGNVLESEAPPIEVESRYLVSLLRRQIQELVHSDGPVAAKRTALGVLIHGIPMTFLEIASLVKADAPELQRDLNVLVQLGIVEVASTPKGESLYQVSRPLEHDYVRPLGSVTAKAALRSF